MKFRKKPVVIEAIQFNGDSDEVIFWLGENSPNSSDVFDFISDQLIEIHTLEGVMKCSKGDWIIKGVKGEFYPCKPDIFEATYERVEEAGVKKGEAR